MINLLPQKHVSLEQSIIGFSSQIISILIKGPVSINELWKTYHESKHIVEHTFDDLLLALDFLYAVQGIDYKEDLICLKSKN